MASGDNDICPLIPERHHYRSQPELAGLTPGTHYSRQSPRQV